MTLGWTFQSQTDINVTALGAFNDVLHNSGNLEIGIWNSSGDLLTSSLVALTGTSSDSVYQSVTPVMLTAGQTYYLGAYSPSQTVYFYVVGPDSDTHGYAIMSPEIQLGGLAFNTNSVFAFPSSTEGQPSDAVVMPNFQFQAVPEPSTVCLLVGGAMVLLAMRRKSNRQ
jgi:PEP-CTERM putative exosortase interaction domain